MDTNSKNLISTGIENGTNIPDLKNSIDDYKTFVINDIEHPLYVIEVSGRLSDKSIPGISNSNSIYAALPGVLAAAPTSPQSPNGANTSVTKELEQENAERKQDKRDSVQEDLNEMVQNSKTDFKDPYMMYKSQSCKNINSVAYKQLQFENNIFGL